MQIKRSGSQPSGKGPAERLTGTARQDPFRCTALGVVIRLGYGELEQGLAFQFAPAFITRHRYRDHVSARR
jgi:hypothetical protein